jgi:hypothetical protein
MKHTHTKLTGIYFMQFMVPFVLFIFACNVSFAIALVSHWSKRPSGIALARLSQSFVLN